tara:strand:- start:524 stop:1456 length:933 start_codon:yes stop_codon:yes gene_type:complete
MFFRNLLKKIRQRKPMLANRMGGFLRQRPQLMERIRNLKNMRGMGRKFMMPGMGLASLPMLGDRDVNDLPIPQAGASLDIMPRFRSLPKQPPQVGTAPLMTGGNAALLPPDIAPLPPKPMMGANMGMPNFMSAGQPPKMVMGMKDGGDVDAEKEYPNEGLAALAKEAPEVVERMGYQEGGEADAQKRMDKSARRNLKMLGRLGRVGLGGGIAGLGLLALDPDVRAAVGRFPQYQDPFYSGLDYSISKFTPDMYQLQNFLTAELSGRPDRVFSLPGLKQSMEAAVAAGEPTFEYRFKPYNTKEVQDFFDNQ